MPSTDVSSHVQAMAAQQSLNSEQNQSQTQSQPGGNQSNSSSVAQGAKSVGPAPSDQNLKMK